MYRWLICCLSCLVLSLAAVAQLPTSTLNGTVTDPQGAVVAGAKVVIINAATGASRETATGSDGGFSVTDLTPGNYTVRINASDSQSANSKRFTSMSAAPSRSTFRSRSPRPERLSK